MADNSNVFILFEEIKTALNGIKSKVEELPNVACLLYTSDAADE